MLRYLLGLALLMGCCAPAQAADEAPLNILFLFSDDHQHTALRASGNTYIHTPNLDRLANSGVRYTHCFSTNPICTPARAAMLTGAYTWTTGVTFFGIPIPPEFKLWPELLQQAGYETCFTGKWHNNGRPDTAGFTHGGNIFLGGMSAHEQLRLHPWGEGEPFTLTGFSSTMFTDSAVEYLNAYDGERPFCLMVSYTAPHDPRTPPGEFAAMYRPDSLPVPPNFREQPPLELFISKIRDEQLLPFPRTVEDIRRETASYYGMISQLDAEIGRILEVLDARGLAERTVVVFAGDHGLALGAHGVVGKQTLYEEGIRTPLIIRHPRLQRAAETNSALVELVDLFPTFCQIAGVPVPEQVAGQSLLPHYSGEATQQRDSLFAMYDDLHRAIRTRSHKLIHHLQTGEQELFDLTADPYELNNLHNSSAPSEIQQQLNQKLQAWLPQVPARK